MRRPLGDLSDPRRFVVLSQGPQGRVGVVLSEEHIGLARLAWLLSKHPHVRLRRLELETAEAAAGQRSRWLPKALTPSSLRRRIPGGMSTRFSHARDWGAVVDRFRELDPVVFHVFHRNLVRAALWRLGAQQTPGWLRAWRQGEFGRGPSPPSVPAARPFQPRRFTRVLRNVEIQQVELRQFVNRLEFPVVRITDDRLLDDEDAVVSDILRRLGVDPPKVEHPPVEHRYERLLGLFEDDDSLTAHLEGTPYAAMLEELRSDR